MKYIEKNPVIINAYKFTGEVTEELKRLGVTEVSSFQVEMECTSCNQSSKNHGLFRVGNRATYICPNQYIIVNDGGIQLMSVENFENIYKPLYTDIVDVEAREVEKVKNEEVN